MKKYLLIFILAAVLILSAVFINNALFSARQENADLEQFTIIVGQDDSREVSEQLKNKGFIKSEFGFDIAFFGVKGIFRPICIDCILPGAYKLSKSMNAWEIAATLNHGPYMKWVGFPEGLRKEEIGEILSTTLNWNNTQKQEWLNVTANQNEYFEGVYFPDTYLIPVDETPEQIAARFIAKFQEKFAPYAKEALNKNIKWDTALKIASIIQREAAGKEDMTLISAIIWNRLLIEMKLDIDATVQYARGNAGQGWWAPIQPADKQIDSPYNTYKYKGLPPHPISNPGLDAIKAALNPLPLGTDCLYYLHDSSSKTIRCAATYEEHLQNIEIYLK